MAQPMMGGPGMGVGGMAAAGLVGGAMVGGMMGGATPDIHTSVPLTAAPPQQGMQMNGNFMHTTPLNKNCCRPMEFVGMYSNGLPITHEEFASLMGELNQGIASMQWRCIPCCCIFCGEDRAIAFVRQKVGEYNARYRSKRLEFGLHEQQHMTMHMHNNMNDPGRGPQMDVRQETTYTLTIQVMQ